jgi:hypothetical protein
VRQPFVQDAPAKQIDRQTMFGGGRESAVQTGMDGELETIVTSFITNVAGWHHCIRAEQTRGRNPLRS